MDTVSLQQAKKLYPSTGLQKPLLFCGVISSLWYIILNIIVTPKYAGYDTVSQTVSELSAIDTDTRTLWIALALVYTLLLAAFGWGVWLSANQNKKLRFVGIVIIVDALFGLFWPPMHRREVIAAGGGTLTDTLHLAWAFIHLVFILLMMGFGAAVFGKRFRIYTIATVIIFLVFGILTSMESGGIKAGSPTPFIGIWERVNMGAYMLWISVFAAAFLRNIKIRNTGNAVNA